MNTKNLTILAGATLILVGAAAVISSRREADTTSIATSEKQAKLFDGLNGKLAEVSKVIVKKGTQETVLAREGDTWTLASKSGYPVKFDLLKPLVAGLAEASIVSAKTSKTDLYDKLEVDDPAGASAKSSLVTLQNAKGETLASLIVGKVDTSGSPSDPFSAPTGDGKQRRFVRRAGEPQSYLVETELNPQTDPLSFVDRTIIEIKNERIRSATITHPAADAAPAQTVEVSRAKQEEATYKLKDMPEGASLKDEYATSRVAQALSYVTFDDVRPASEVDWNDPKAIKGTFDCFDGTSVQFTFVEKDGKSWTKFAATYTAPPEPPAVAAPAPASAPAAAAPATDASKPAPAGSKEAELAAAAQAIRDSVKKDAADLNAKLEKWAFALPDFKATQLKTKVADLLAAPKAPAAAPTNPAAPAGQPGDMLLQPK